LISSRLFHLFLLIVFCAIGESLYAQEIETIEIADTIKFTSDSATIAASFLDSNAIDSVNLDSLQPDSTLPKKRKSTLDHDVNYSAEDSMLIDLAHEMVYLYGDAVAEYGDIRLEADYIEIALGNSELRASGLPDSTGEMAGFPVFTQGDQKFDSKEMRYNFKTQRGLSKSVVTQEGEGYLHGELIKKDTGNVIYIANGMYTTCEYSEPHFHIHAKKLKVITEDKIITGPAYLSVADIPTPLVVPFGFFPNSTKRANGLIIPSYDLNNARGIGIQGGGYYFGLGDYADFALTGDIYTNGSWRASISSGYAKRYKFNGTAGVEFTKFYNSEPGFLDYVDYPLVYNVKWTHRQDPKAKPGRNLSASVDFGSPKSQKYNISTSRDVYTRSSVKSNIKYSKVFTNTPFSFSSAIASSQNPNTGEVNLQAPDAALTMSRIFPFKRKIAVGEEKAWEKIGVQATLSGKNEVTAQYSKLFTDSTLRAMKNGAQLSVPITGNYKMLKYVTVSPNVTNKFVGVRQTISREYNADSARIEENRVNQLNGYWQGSSSLTFSTIVYGLYRYRNDVLRALRHQMIPSVSIGYTPDYSDPAWGYYKSVQSDSLGNTQRYSVFAGGVYGAPSSSEAGVIGFSLNNTFEAKVRDLQDSVGTGEKKIKLLDQFSLGTAYNIVKDSINWSPLNINMRTMAIKGLDLQAAATLNPYAQNRLTGVDINQSQFRQTGKIGRWTRASATASYTLSPKSKKKTIEEKKQKLSDMGLYYTDFIDFDIPWSARIRYNISYTESGFNSTLLHNIDLDGNINITQNWKVGVFTGYDLVTQQIATTTFNIYRDLHCWEMSLGITPFGLRQSYTFSLNVKASTLSDLKIPRQKTFTVPAR
jgi:hypothetical protein